LYSDRIHIKDELSKLVRVLVDEPTGTIKGDASAAMNRIFSRRGKIAHAVVDVDLPDASLVDGHLDAKVDIELKPLRSS